MTTLPQLHHKYFAAHHTDQATERQYLIALRLVARWLKKPIEEVIVRFAVTGQPATRRMRRPMGADVASTWPVMITSAICRVKGTSSQKPRPKASTTRPTHRAARAAPSRPATDSRPARSRHPRRFWQ